MNDDHRIRLDFSALALWQEENQPAVESGTKSRPINIVLDLPD
ncbi:hypothetical protein STRCR_2134 [Streptococcus criceti HS-6]|uniref:Uncharacterized protein n=1 Tax=Streptococcus criceti HS-6 TaxID=873449 RepID=G5JSD5_STRCG|nr:hypothetical protein STRCR_2134 [Streptococcus criceti HS-6]